MGRRDSRYLSVDEFINVFPGCPEAAGGDESSLRRSSAAWRFSSWCWLRRERSVRNRRTQTAAAAAPVTETGRHGVGARRLHSGSSSSHASSCGSETGRCRRFLRPQSPRQRVHRRPRRRRPSRRRPSRRRPRRRTPSRRRLPHLIPASSCLTVPPRQSTTDDRETEGTNANCRTNR